MTWYMVNSGGAGSLVRSVSHFWNAGKSSEEEI